MTSLEKILIENMIRFGSKNLTESDQRKLKQLLKEQGTVNISEATEAIAVQPADWGIAGFTPPVVSSNELFVVETGEDVLTRRSAAWTDAYDTYLDGASGYVGKTLLVFKNKSLDPREIVDRISIQASYSLSYDQKSIQFWTTAATRNFDKAANTMIVAANATPLDTGFFAGAYDVVGDAGLVDANLRIGLDQFDMTPSQGGTETAPCVYKPELIKGEPLPVKLKGATYSVNYLGEVRKAGQVIGYTPAHAYTAIPSIVEGYGFTLANGKAVPLQDSEDWYKSFKTVIPSKKR